MFDPIKDNYTQSSDDAKQLASTAQLGLLLIPRPFSVVASDGGDERVGDVLEHLVVDTQGGRFHKGLRCGRQEAWHLHKSTEDKTNSERIGDR